MSDPSINKPEMQKKITLPSKFGAYRTTENILDKRIATNLWKLLGKAAIAF